jgi:membrane protein implicated in regulation of membrane protease activity
MGVLVALMVGLVFWIAAWAFGMKAFDAILVTVFLVVSAQAVHVVTPFVRKLLGREQEPLPERSQF